MILKGLSLTGGGVLTGLTMTIGFLASVCGARPNRSSLDAFANLEPMFGKIVLSVVLAQQGYKEVEIISQAMNGVFLEL